MLKEALVGTLDEKELASLSGAFDVIGDIAIIKIPDELSGWENLIASQILSRVKNVRTVLKQQSPVHGEFRTRNVVHIGGEEKYTTIYKESACSFKVDVRSVYFSPRLSTERQRVMEQVREGERILNMFAGIGTFSIIIAKNKDCTIESIDRNPAAIELCLESLKLNSKLKGKVIPILSDAREYALNHPNEFDRILMPLPERATEFLHAAMVSAKETEGTTVHYYLHLTEEDFYDGNWLDGHIASFHFQRKYKIANWKRVREVGPHYIQAVADIFLL